MHARVLTLEGRGLSVLALATLMLAACVLADHHEGHEEKPEGSLQDQKIEDYQKLGDRLDRITARLEWIDKKLDKRLSPKLRQRALSLEHRLAELEDPHCDEHHYDCGGQDHECVPRLEVCDGRRDCRNGDDEKHCTLPTNTGDRFVGYQVYDHCDQGHMTKATMVITEVKVRPAYAAFPMVRAMIQSIDNDDEDRIEIAYHMVGYYKFSAQNLILLPPSGSAGLENLGMVLDFDGHDPDRAVAHIVNQVSLRECAKFVFFREKSRKHDDDDDDDDEHHGKHGHN